MKNKIFVALGLIVLIVSVMAYFMFDTAVRQNSTAMGVNVLIAKQNIPEGFIIRDTETATEYFDVKRMVQSEVVPSALNVNVQSKTSGNLIEKVKQIFSPKDYEITEADLKGLVGRKSTQTILKNQQVISGFLTTDLTEYKEDERLFAVPTNLQASVGAEVGKGDWVDLWISYNDKARNGLSTKLLGPLKVIKVKDANNAEINDSNSALIPQIVIVKMNEEQIRKVSEEMKSGDLFLTKYGTNPKVNKVESQPEHLDATTQDDAVQGETQQDQSTEPDQHSGTNSTESVTTESTTQVTP